MDDYSLDTVVSWCRVKRVGITTCPLCASNGPLDSPELVDHVLSHTYDFALRALPWPLAARNKASTTIGTYCSLVSQDVTEEWEESISYQETRRLSWVKNLKLEEGTPDWRTDNDDIYPFATPQVWDNPGIQLSSLEKKMESAAKSDEFEDGVDYFADGGYFEDESADGSSEPQIDGNSRHSRQKEDQYSRPSCREDFEIAIICALILEYDAVALLFDEFWDEDGDEFGRAAGDDNTYTTGRIGNHNVVLALLPGMGKVSEAAAAANMRSTYVALRLVLLAGICGGAPHYNQYEILLGDVIISNTVIQYNFGRRYPDAFASKRDENIRTLLATFETDLGRDELRKTTAYFLRQLQKNAGNRQNKYKYPGTAEDKLFESGHRHKHRISPACICSHCHGRMDPVCAGALASSCNDLGCDERYLVKRNRLEARRQLEQGGKNEVQDPAIYAGTIASSDTIIKSGEDRDRIIQEEGIIAFQMEGAGVWEEVPHIMVKGVCDYADCHKNKKWQDFAAATAASALKAILERYNQTDKRQGPVVEELPCHFLVPFKRNRGFVGREAILSELLGRILPGTNKEDCQRTIIQGLGGVGKTQIALEAIYRLRNKRLDCSIFWVSAADVNTFENSYREIGRHIKIKGIDEEKADVKRLVKTALSDESIGSWLLVVDNADDTGLLFEPICLSDYLPFSRKGSILLTTRNQTVASRLGIQGASIITTAEMYDVEARFMLYQGLNPSQISNANSTERLLHILANLPLAIRQACAYMAENQISTSEYLNLCESKRDMIRLLGRDFDDPHQYKSIPNAVTTTWLTSFNHISKHDPPAAEYLKFMSLLAEKDIPKSLLPMEAIGTLEAYAFIAQREGQDSIDMHRLVRIAVQNWLEGKGELNVYVTSAIQRLNHAFPFPKHENKDIWIRYLPHAETALKFQVQHKGGKVEASLLNKVAHSYYLLGQYQKAEQVYWQALQLCREVLGKEHPDTLISMNNLASVLSDLGKDEEAEKMHRQTLQLKEKVLGKEHPSTLKSLDNLGEVLLKLEKWNELEQLNRQILLMHRRRADELADTTAKGESARQGAPVYAKKSE
ncbi:hypothetical protein QQS21_012665 [Conoideocrella luteorostrata]|uniref:NB-ARC domain-containing protein n=1 Tax=Conoideocrella luteorostrata TaxID=1105319 RepID=A0AAJ0CAR5_9HYPO|nr:hypothetical protein QQS21_012665 [Conoideocrella luteorostrata]